MSGGKALGCCFGSRDDQCGNSHVPVSIGRKEHDKKTAEGSDVWWGVRVVRMSVIFVRIKISAMKPTIEIQYKNVPREIFSDFEKLDKSVGVKIYHDENDHFDAPAEILIY